MYYIICEGAAIRRALELRLKLNVVTDQCGQAVETLMSSRERGRNIEVEIGLGLE